MSDTDLQLLARYTRKHSEDAFAELVRHHLGLVYSAALRQVRSPQLAEEVAQSAFTDLARNAHRLAPDTILTAWLYQVTRRTAIDVVRREARRQVREQVAAEMNAMNASASEWTQIEPLLDDAMAALDETDRAAVLLRYFENKSLREVGATLGTTDDAAQKRVSRALERLREFFSKRGVTVGAGGLTVVISGNAIQAAPVGLGVTISSFAALVGKTVATTATATAVKAIAMTTLQKSILTATVALLAGAGIYETRQASQLRDQIQALQQQQAPLTESIKQLSSDHEALTSKLAAMHDENERLNRNTTELLRLRAETTKLHAELSGLRAQTASGKQTENGSPSVAAVQSQNLFVTVTGRVNAPSQMVWTQGMKLTDAIRKSEMLDQYAGTKASVTDASGTRSEYDLRDIVSGRGENPLIKPGSTVHVPRLEGSLNADVANRFHVTRASVLPNHWPWTNGLRLRDAITMVGGLTEYADGRLQIIHHNKGPSEVFHLHDIQTGRADNPRLEAGDSIHVKPPRPASN